MAKPIEQSRVGRIGTDVFLFFDFMMWTVCDAASTLVSFFAAL
jgi:hypothetical protein